MSRRTASIFLAALLPLLTCATAIHAQAIQQPQVICHPCGEVPPPRGYVCSGQAMIADSVATADAPRVIATCRSPDKPQLPTASIPPVPPPPPAGATTPPATSSLSPSHAVCSPRARVNPATPSPPCHYHHRRLSHHRRSRKATASREIP